jgi:hypothetical protein
MALEATTTIDGEELQLLHQRDYSVQVYRRNDDEILAVGTVHDRKPPGLYVEEDPDELTIHFMTVKLIVSFPGLEITSAEVDYGSFPQPGCPGIVEAYRGLVGISIARGFTHKVRELFGGPRGCTHVTALLQAMAPAVVQSTWSMRVLGRREGTQSVADTRVDTLNLNTCHVWAEDGELVTRVRQGEHFGPGIPVRDRLVKLGRDPAEWFERGH